MHVAPYGGLIRIFGSPVWTGYAMSGASLLLLVSGVVTFLRRSGVLTPVALSCAVMVMASQVTQGGLMSVRADALPAGLAIWGLAALLLPAGRGRLLTAGGLFTLAFAAKLTAVAGLLAGLAWLVRVGRRRDAVTLGLTVGGGAAILLAVMHLASNGRALDLVFRSGMSGLNATALLLAPSARLLRKSAVARISSDGTWGNERQGASFWRRARKPSGSRAGRGSRDMMCGWWPRPWSARWASASGD